MMRARDKEVAVLLPLNARKTQTAEKKKNARIQKKKKDAQRYKKKKKDAQTAFQKEVQE
jgi:uncharacterized protein (DUF302 family)